MDRDLVYQKREMKGREDEFVRVKQQVSHATWYPMGARWRPAHGIQCDMVSRATWQLQAAMNEKEKLVDKLSLIVHETERKKSQRLEEIMARFKTQQ